MCAVFMCFSLSISVLFVVVGFRFLPVAFAFSEDLINWRFVVVSGSIVLVFA